MRRWANVATSSMVESENFKIAGPIIAEAR
jgi:hypothetical protein